jgi:hypothetical protein
LSSSPPLFVELGEGHSMARVFFGEDEPRFAIRDILWLGNVYAAEAVIDYQALLARVASELGDATKEARRESSATDIRTLVEGEVHERAGAAARLAVAMIVPGVRGEVPDDEDEYSGL